MNLFLAPLRPLADVLDLTAEALAAVGTISVTALSLALTTREADGRDHAARLRVVPTKS